MEDKRFISHAHVEAVLRKAGYSEQKIKTVLRDLPDPIDLEHERDALFRQGISVGKMIDRMGGSP